MELLEKFGINFPVLIAQVVNFLIVLGVLYKFAYKPVLKMLHDRTKLIENGVKNAEKAKVAVEEAEKKQERVLAEARVESQSILAKTREQAEAQREILMQQSKDEAARLIEKTKADLAAEHAQLLQNAKAEVADIVLAATEKLLKEKVTPEKDRAFVSKILEETK